MSFHNDGDGLSDEKEEDLKSLQGVSKKGKSSNMSPQLYDVSMYILTITKQV